jgi:hypothetical protein
MKTDKSNALLHPPLPDIDEVEPLSEKDGVCLKELKEVLKKHNSLSRFGITLLHQHFPVADDEVLVESCDEQTRTLTIRPVKKATVGDYQLIQTNWRLDTGGALALCTTYCPPGPRGHSGSPIHVR